MLEKFIVVSGRWICGTGGVFTMLAAAVYGALKKEKDKKWIWTDILLGLPAAVIDVIMFIKTDMPQNEFITREYECVMLFVRIILLLFQTAAGMWLGRLITGRYKGERQLYPLDILYTAAACVCCYILCAASKTSWIIINVSKDSCYDRNRYGTVIILFFAASVLYGIFSKAEELHERVVRAMTVGFLAFFAFDWVYIADKYNEFVMIHGEKLANDSRLRVFMENSGIWPAVFAGIAAAGVITGYYWRIMKADKK